MWIALTLFDGRPVRVNMNQALSYHEKNDLTIIDFGFSECQVKESMDEITILCQPRSGQSYGAQYNNGQPHNYNMPGNWR